MGIHRMLVWAAVCTAGAWVVAGCGGAAGRPRSGEGASVAGSMERNQPGARPDGRVRLPNQWMLDPAGRHLPLGDFPVNIAVHPSGRHSAVLHSGYAQHEVILVDLQAKPERVVSRVNLDEAFHGLAWSTDGRELYASGASGEVVYVLGFADGHLQGMRTVALRDPKLRGIPAGIAVVPGGGRLYVANVLGHSVDEVRLAGGAAGGGEVTGIPLVPGEIRVMPADRTPQGSEDEEAITKRARALLESLDGASPYPYGCVVDAARGRLYVSLWGLSAVEVIEMATRKSVGRWAVEAHPNEMVLSRSGRHLFVANANRNTVSVVETEGGRTVETLLAELEPGSPPGSTPNSVALSPDGTLLFVANANINAIAVFDVAEPGRSRSLGFIPTGWYPTSVRVTPDGRRLLVASGKGLASRSNRYGPQPGVEAPGTIREYIARILPGTLSIVDLPAGRERLEEQLGLMTARVYRCRPEVPAPELPAGHPVPTPAALEAALAAGGGRKPGAAAPEVSPIRYCLYVIKENRTYDQVFGDMPEGRGDPSLCLFPEAVTPNHHRLAREFVLLDNFYVESEVSADGHEWTVGAHASDFVEKMWPMSYGHNASRKYSYPAEGRFKIAEPAGGYLWDRAREAGVTYRSYGEFVNNATSTNEPATTRMPGLAGHFDPWFRSFDMDYSDLDRVDRFVSELRRFESEGDMPRLQIVRLPNDHTAGTSAGKLTPTSYVAQNDLALGRLVEAVSRSRFWAQTAIFVVEDDAQNGPDHIDAHRTVALVVSPYTRRRGVDSNLYSTSSMLRTMELILGLRPMTQFDAAALPMYASFGARPDAAPYVAVEPRVSLEDRNVKGAWGGDLSEGMDFAREDAADDLLLNRILWHSVRGPNLAMPAPVRAGFVRIGGGEDEEEEEEERERARARRGRR